MTISVAATRRHVNSSAPAFDRAPPPQQAAPNSDPLDFGEPIEPPGDEDDRRTRHWLYRPAATPTAAGITPGYEWMLQEDRTVTRAELRREVERMEAAMASLRKPILALINAVKELQTDNAALREEVRALKSRPAAGKSSGTRTTRGSKKGGAR